MKNTTITVVIVVLLVIGAVYVFVNKDKIFEKKDVNNNNNTQTVGPRIYNVEIKDNTFIPDTLNVKAGDTVIWTNKEGVRHVILSDRLAEINSKTLSNGDNYTHTFNKAGEFPYHCEVHFSMKGKIVVGPVANLTI